MRFCLDLKDDQPILIPFDAPARQFLAAQTDGEPIEVEAYHPRDMIFHRFLMSQIGDLAKALHTTHEKMRAELLYATGNFTLVGNLTGGTPVVAVSSMSRHSMTDRELHIFWDESRDVIISRLLPLVEDDAERARLQDLLLQPAY
jgi:hypothetical protein